MINVKVIKISDMIKYAFGSMFVIMLCLGAGKILSNEDIQEKKEISFETKVFAKNALTACLGQVITAMDINQEEQEEVSFLQEIMEIQLSVMDLEKYKKAEEKVYVEQEEPVEENEIEEAKTGLATEVIDQSGINTKFTNEYGSVKIKNESKYQLTEEMLTPNIELTNKKDIILYHTHTCESYTASEGYEYQPTGNFRTTDLNFSVARVGGELASYLSKYGYNVTQDTTYHDYPAYSGSYNRSLTTIKNRIAVNPGSQIVFDIHRDAVGSTSTYAPTVKIGEEYAAQIMFVMGTNGGGLSHSNWQENLKFAVKVQEKANELYPGLMKPIILRNSRYNQHAAKAASIIEVGATGNTLDQCLNSMKYFSKVLDEVLK